MKLHCIDANVHPCCGCVDAMRTDRRTELLASTQALPALTSISG